MDKDSFKKLYLRLYPELIVYGRTITTDEQLVEDVVQELFIFLWEKRNSLETILSLESYLYVSFRHNLIRRLKQLGDKSLLTEPAGGNGAPTDELLEKEIEIRQLLSKLPPRQREVLFLRYYKNKSYQEISAQMGINYQVARNFSYRAIRFLKKQMKYLPAMIVALLHG